MFDDPVWQMVELAMRSHKGGKHLPRIAREQNADPRKRYAAERSRYSRTEGEFRRWCQNHLKGYYDGEVNRSQFYKEFSQRLYEYQVKQYIIGRRTLGRTDERMTEQERKMLHGQHSKEMRFFNKFLRDMDAGAGRMPYNQRMDLYALTGYRMYLRGAVSAIPFADQVKFGYRVNRAKENCEDCLAKEADNVARGGWTLAELEAKGYPGENCRCGRRCACGIFVIGSERKLNRTRPTTFSSVRRGGAGGSGRAADRKEKTRK